VGDRMVGVAAEDGSQRLGESHNASPGKGEALMWGWRRTGPWEIASQLRGPGKTAGKAEPWSRTEATWARKTLGPLWKAGCRGPGRNVKAAFVLCPHSQNASMQIELGHPLLACFPPSGDGRASEQNAP
jgi:hypothetical protein